LAAEATFWDKVDLDVSLGFDYAKSTDIFNYLMAVEYKHTANDRHTDAEKSDYGVVTSLGWSN
jgi:hypothetical protein